MIQTLELIGSPPTLNEVRRMHFHQQATVKKQWERVVEIETKVQQIQPVSGPVVITYRFHFTDDRRRDPDNYSVKSIQDGLVKSGILPDDNFKIVRELRICEGERRKVKGITIEIQPMY